MKKGIALSINAVFTVVMVMIVLGLLVAVLSEAGPAKVVKDTIANFLGIKGDILKGLFGGGGQNGGQPGSSATVELETVLGTNKITVSNVHGEDHVLIFHSTKLTFDVDSNVVFTHFQSLEIISTVKFPEYCNWPYESTHPELWNGKGQFHFSYNNFCDNADKFEIKISRKTTDTTTRPYKETTEEIATFCAVCKGDVDNCDFDVYPCSCDNYLDDKGRCKTDEEICGPRPTRKKTCVQDTYFTGDKKNCKCINGKWEQCEDETFDIYKYCKENYRKNFASCEEATCGDIPSEPKDVKDVEGGLKCYDCIVPDCTGGVKIISNLGDPADVDVGGVWKLKPELTLFAPNAKLCSCWNFNADEDKKYTVCVGEISDKCAKYLDVNNYDTHKSWNSEFAMDTTKADKGTVEVKVMKMDPSSTEKVCWLSDTIDYEIHKICPVPSHKKLDVPKNVLREDPEGRICQVVKNSAAHLVKMYGEAKISDWKYGGLYGLQGIKGAWWLWKNCRLLIQVDQSGNIVSRHFFRITSGVAGCIKGTGITECSGAEQCGQVGEVGECDQDCSENGDCNPNCGKGVCEPDPDCKCIAGEELKCVDNPEEKGYYLEKCKEDGSGWEPYPNENLESFACDLPEGVSEYTTCEPNMHKLKLVCNKNGGPMAIEKCCDDICVNAVSQTGKPIGVCLGEG